MKAEINEEVRKQIKDYFQQTKVLYGAFLAGLILFLLTAYLVVFFQGPMNLEYGTFLVVASPLSGIALIIMSYRLFASRLKSARTGENLYEKMESYRAALVLRLLIMDGAAFIQMIAFIMTGNKMFLALSLVVGTLFFMIRPSMERLISDLELEDLEARVLRDHYK